MRSLGFSLTTITEMLRQPMEAPAEGGRPRLSNASLKSLRETLGAQLATLDTRVAPGAPRAQGSRGPAGPSCAGTPTTSNAAWPANWWRRPCAAARGAPGVMTAPAPRPASARGFSAVAWMPWAIGLVTAVDYFDNALFAFFASYIAGGVNASPDELVWASSAYALGAVLGILQQHAWIERLGYRRYLALCMFACRGRPRRRLVRQFHPARAGARRAGLLCGADARRLPHPDPDRHAGRAPRQGAQGLHGADRLRRRAGAGGRRLTGSRTSTGAGCSAAPCRRRC